MLTQKVSGYGLAYAETSKNPPAEIILSGQFIPPSQVSPRISNKTCPIDERQPASDIY